ncbi:hypothetical protein ONV78_07410 [Hahella sp. CR1]|uniref:hypothetical protein n=1 Tax=Hahella sp. CR1 TaxID=2992807 RepID=UPI00244354F6|nr:hypothetical protein [Hahella sp. CR1]MDG9667553.1 hypothetical protein [Hahella sp. CR1]
MDKKCVWIIFTKSLVLSNRCSIAFDGCDYYCTEAYVPSYDEGIPPIDKMITQVKQKLSQDYLELKEVKKCIKFISDEWTTSTELNEEVIVYSQKALSENRIMFGGFRPEEIEEITQYNHIISELEI